MSIYIYLIYHISIKIATGAEKPLSSHRDSTKIVWDALQQDVKKVAG